MPPHTRVVRLTARVLVEDPEHAELLHDRLMTNALEQGMEEVVIEGLDPQDEQ